MLATLPRPKSPWRADTAGRTRTATLRQAGAEAGGVIASLGYKFVRKGAVCTEKASDSGPGALVRTYLEDCLAGCDGVDDCKFATLSRNGDCRYWKNCDVTEEKTNGLIFERTSEEEEEEEEEEEDTGFSLILTDLKCPPHQANRASFAGPWGSGHSLESCLEGCKDVEDCAFVTMNKPAFCRYWKSCDAPVEASGFRVWQKDVEDSVAESTVEPEVAEDHVLPDPVYNGQLCKVRASSPGPFGKGHSLESCKAGCLDVSDCHFMSINKQGFCRFWKECDERRNVANAYVYRRIFAAQPTTEEPATAEPTTVSPTTGDLETTAGAGGDYVKPEPLHQDQLCKARASNPGPSGAGHTLSDCKAGCLAVSDCHFMSHNIRGFCRRTANNAAIYERVFAEQPETDAPTTTEPETEELDVTFSTHSSGVVCSNAASTRGMWGRDRREQECKESCAAVHDCNFVSLDSKGFCRFWKDCDEPSAKLGATVWEAQREETISYTPVMSDKWCVGSFAEYKGPWGKGHSVEACVGGCSNYDDCQFVTMSAGGHCRYWSSCDLQEAKANAKIYARPE